MRWIAVVAVLAAVAGIAVGMLATSSLRWRRRTTRVVAQLHAEPSARELAVVSETELATLPPVVARYFRFALPPGQRPIQQARVGQTGEMDLGGDKGWKPFDAVEDFHVDRPGFVWDAKLHMAPLTDVFVRDSYVAGEGSMSGRVAGLVRVIDLHGTPEIAKGSLQRYLAEAVWLPTSLLPSAGVVWTSIDERTARATLTDGAVSASFDFRFGARGEIVGGSAMRYRETDGRLVPTRWDGEFSQYARVHEMMIPMHGDVAWMLPEGRAPYWRGDLNSVDYVLR